MTSNIQRCIKVCSLIQIFGDTRTGVRARARGAAMSDLTAADIMAAHKLSRAATYEHMRRAVGRERGPKLF